MDHYKVLGVDRNASKSEIKEAFRRLALKYHPDKHSDSTKSARDNATLRFKQASEAYEVLIDERKRADYSQNLNRRRTGGAYGHYDHNRHRSYSYNRTPRWGFDLDATLRFMTTRAFLLNLAFAGVLLGGAAFIDSTGQTLWNMQMCLLSVFIQRGSSIWLNLPKAGTKCVSEEIQTNVVVLADYSVLPDDNSHAQPTISVKVTSPYGNNLHHIENVTHGQFAFTTTEAGNYLACMWIDGQHQGVNGATVNLDWRTGIAAKDWESVARKEKIEGVELELRKLEGAVEAIHENLLYLKSREADMREVSEKTNSRVAWFSIGSLFVCIVMSGLQLWRLKNYFHKKKLI